MQETGRDVRGGALGGAAALESLEDPAYRGLPDLGYPSRQTFRTLSSVPSFMYSTCRQPPSHYFEQLDTYLHSGRDLDLELEGGRPGSSGQLEKKAKSGSSRREEGGLLPPLLALAPQVVHIIDNLCNCPSYLYFSGAAAISWPRTEDGLLPVSWPRPSHCALPARWHHRLHQHGLLVSTSRCPGEGCRNNLANIED